MNACRLAVTAAFARGMPNYPTRPPRPPVEQPVTIYHAQPHGNRDPLSAAGAARYFRGHWQRDGAEDGHAGLPPEPEEWLDASQGFDSYLQTMHELMREVGRMSGKFEYAEGWRRHSHLGLCAADADPLGDALAKQVMMAP